MTCATTGTPRPGGVGRCSDTAGGRNGSSAACRRTGSTSTWATSRRRPRRERALPEGAGVRRRRGAVAARLRRRRRQGGGRAQGGAVVLPPRPRRRTPAGDRLTLRPDARAGDRSMVSDAEFALDRATGRGRLRPPAGRHVAAVAAARAPCTTSRPGTSVLADGRAGRCGAARGEAPTGRRPRALGGLPRSPSTGSPSCSPGSAAATTPAPAARRRRPICVLSGDVHHAYAAARRTPATTCSRRSTS